MRNVAAGQLSLLVEVDADELSESGRIVVAHGLRVAERFQNRIRSHDLVLQRDLSASLLKYCVLSKLFPIY